MKTYEISGEQCYSAQDFADLVHKTRSTIYALVARGNSVRHLRAHRVGSQLFIPVTEFTEFDWVSSGRYGKRHTYRFTSDGQMVNTNLRTRKEPKE